jgi:hypothetical protein
MNLVDSSTLKYVFFLMALLIIVAYFAGAATETKSLASGASLIINTLTGRNASGQFSAYPSGAPAIA